MPDRTQWFNDLSQAHWTIRTKSDAGEIYTDTLRPYSTNLVYSHSVTLPSSLAPQLFNKSTQPYCVSFVMPVSVCSFCSTTSILVDVMFYSIFPTLNYLHLVTFTINFNIIYASQTIKT